MIMLCALLDRLRSLDIHTYIICINLSNIGGMTANMMSTNEYNIMMPEVFTFTLLNLH